MAKFLNTSATSYFLEELIKNASERLILISPYLKLNDRIKELLCDKNRLKIDVRIVYGKNDLLPREIEWLRELDFVRTSFCKNLHAKCYLNEDRCIVTSLNLYEFSQVNNNEMGVMLLRDENPEAFRDTYEEAQRLIRISEEISITLEKDGPAADAHESKVVKVSTSKIAKKNKLKTDELLERLTKLGYLQLSEDRHQLTSAGLEAGAELINSKKFGEYFIWPDDIAVK